MQACSLLAAILFLTLDVLVCCVAVKNYSNYIVLNDSTMHIQCQCGYVYSGLINDNELNLKEACQMTHGLLAPPFPLRYCTVINTTNGCPQKMLRVPCTSGCNGELYKLS